MGALFSSPKIPTPDIPPAPPAALPPTLASPGLALAGNAQKQMAAAAAGDTVTNAGGAQGLPDATAPKRSLLG